MNGSVDTLKLHLQGFDIDKGANILIQPGIVDHASGAVNDDVLYSGAVKIEGAKAFLNKSAYNFTLNTHGAFLQCSVPKIFHGNNERPVTGDQVSGVISFLENDLKANGIHANLDTAKLTRVDIFKQDTFRYSFPDYTPVLSLLRGKRQWKRAYGTTYLFGNTQRELCVYDKGVERQNGEGEREVTSTNDIRAEVRLLSHRPVSKATGMDTVTDLVKGYGHLTAVYNKEIQKYFDVSIEANKEIHQYYLFAGDVEAEVRYIKHLNGGKLGMKQIKQYLSVKAWQFLSDRISLPVFIDTVVQVSDYKNPYVLRSRLERFSKELLFTWKALPGKTKELYNEMYLKLAV